MRTDLELRDEVRFGIVLYGGVSLAIYINGVVQELLKMVQATSPDYLGDVSASTRSIYRELGQSLGLPPVPPNGRASEADKIHTRFIVDVISGTSAGGINGVFLAKALAQQQELNQIQQLWITEGDISSLLNDKESVPPRFTQQTPPQSLLNSQRMYVKLLEALQSMDAAFPTGKALVDEVDLYVTATDLRGHVRPLPLEEGRIFERKHKAVFHFSYSHSNPISDFIPANNPFLAFAARCTSSFPAAFEPMALTDIDDVLWRKGIRDLDPQTGNTSESELWSHFYHDYLRETGLPSVPFPHRCFADGGYLDNKPFSFVIEKMSERQPILPALRKLIYIEPDPQHPEDDVLTSAKPDPIDNGWAALSALPRYETIREDLERILQRNEEVDRIVRLIDAVEDAKSLIENTEWEKQRTAAAVVPVAKGTTPAAPSMNVRLSAAEWAALDSNLILQKYGLCYLVYHRLKISVVTEQLATQVCHYYQTDPDSADGKAVPQLVLAWRARIYEQPTADGRVDQLNQFLDSFDISFRIRRLHATMIQLHGEFDNADATLVTLLNQIAQALRQASETLQSLLDDRQVLAPLGTLCDLRALIGMPTAAGPAQGAQAQPPQAVTADDLLANPNIFGTLNQAAQKVKQLFAVQIDAARALVDAVLPQSGSPSVPIGSPQKRLREFYDNYEDHDAVSFPLFYNTGFGDPVRVDVTRVSPVDATSLVDESREPPSNRKLRGVNFGAFGGFLDQGWRKNDMMWGRLDGAERIITALLPNDDQRELRQELIAKAQTVILQEELPAASTAPGYSAPTPLERLQSHRETLPTDPDPSLMAHALGRGSTISGNMLAAIEKARSWNKHPSAWLVFGGRLFNGLVEAATPHGFWATMATYWKQVLLVLSLLLIGFGFALTLLFVSGGFLHPALMSQFGLELLGITFLAGIAVAVVRDYLVNSRRVAFTLASLLVIGVVGLAAYGGWQLTPVLRKDFLAAGWLERADMFFRGLIVIAGATMLIIGAWMTNQAKQLKFPPGANVTSPMLDLELARTASDYWPIAGKFWHPNRLVLEALESADYWFISAYSLFFLAWGALVVRVPSVPLWAAVSAAASAAVGIAAGQCDRKENNHIDALIADKTDDDAQINQYLKALRPWSLFKWGMFFGAVSLGGASLQPMAFRWLAWAGAIAGVLGTLGVIGTLLAAKSPALGKKLIRFATLFLVPLLLAIVVMLAWRPQLL